MTAEQDAAEFREALIYAVRVGRHLPAHTVADAILPKINGYVEQRVADAYDGGYVDGFRDMFNRAEREQADAVKRAKAEVFARGCPRCHRWAGMAG